MSKDKVVELPKERKVEDNPFAEIEKKNKEKAERLKREREQHNRKIKRKYNL